MNALAALCSPLAESRTHCLKKKAERLSTPVSKLPQHVPLLHIEEGCRGRTRQGSLTPHPPFKSVCGKTAFWHKYLTPVILFLGLL